MSRSGAPSGDTIVAIATPPGTGAVGLIRLSGAAAVDLADPVLGLASGRRLGAIRPRTLYRARVIDPGSGEEIDEALVAVMPGPRSHTGENVVEISCHGNPVLLGRIVEILVHRGARLAEPGEFTRRAYVNGRIDLVQAEAVAMLIGARSESAARLAMRQIRGALSKTLQDLREAGLDLVAGLEVSIDFPDEEIGLSQADAIARCAELAHRLGRLASGVRHGRAIHTGLSVTLIGAPNVGKSSLLNALLGRNRAIVSPRQGTTRDLVDGEIGLGGVMVRLADGAGLGEPQDEIDAESMARTRRAADESDLVMVVLDRSRPLSEDDGRVLGMTEGRTRLVIANKSDLPAAWSGVPVDCACSALTGAAVAEVRQRLEAWVNGRVTADGDEGGVVASLRVGQQIEQAGAGIERARMALADDLPLEAVLVDLREALGALDRALGLDVDEAILDRIFAMFCVGK